VQEDRKSQCIGVHIAQALASATAHGYRRIDMPWTMHSSDGLKVVDEGMIYLRRNKDGSFSIRVTDKYTGK